MPSKNTKKKMKQNAKSVNKQEEKIIAETEIVETEIAINEEKVEPKTEIVATETKTDSEKEKQKKQTKKEKKPSKTKKKIKEVASELKKVTWPTFPQVVKKTSTVIAVVIIFSIVLLGIDALLEMAYKLFINGIN
ncbi:MAG: preprotein translocase subunit SecE [Clostridia bacterium]|nr:preprotein translocase subunit SecE [Clostridia bacterium]